MFPTTTATPVLRTAFAALFLAVAATGPVAAPTTALTASDPVRSIPAHGATTESAPRTALGTPERNSGWSADPFQTEMATVTPAPADIAGAPVDPTPPASAPAPDDPLAPLASPDAGEYCTDGLGADELSAFFAEPIGSFRGGDYQRALRLDDDRVLWTFQDAFVDGTLVHNVAFVQSGRCFQPLHEGRRSWLFADLTDHMSRWHWILAGTQSADRTIHLFVVEMRERGHGYLGRTEPSALRRAVLDPETFDVIRIVDEPIHGIDLYGWSITEDSTHTYLYSHCYRQFGFTELFGTDACAENVKLARASRGDLDGPREYWSDGDWVNDPALATPVIDREFVGSVNNPVQIRFDGARFQLIQKRDDWWSGKIDIAVATDPEGPFVPVAELHEQIKCEEWVCNTYFASWVPWNDDDGEAIWSIGHNRWNGSETASNLHVYRPTLHSIGI